MRHRLTLAIGAAVAALLVWVPAAVAKYLGTDVLGNIGPRSQLGAGTLVDRYPLSRYGLDTHVDVGVTDLDGVPPTIAHWAAAQLWSVTSFLMRLVIDLFTWAFSLDLLGGQAGALDPVSDAVASLWENVIGETWMIAAVIAAGMWGIWKALVQRRYTETAAGLTVSVVFVVVAMFFVFQPERTIGQASQWTNSLSLAFLSGTSSGTVDDPQAAKRRVADELFEAQILRPWVVLNFGGLSHCVDLGRRNEDGYPTPVSPHDSRATVCRDHRKPGRDGHGGYAPRFLRYPAGSEQRTAEYEALRTGETPQVSAQFAGYRVDKSDSPAVDIQQAGGAFQRLTVAVIIFIGALGAICLLGFLSLAVILAQVVALVLLCFAPVALVIGVFPGRGHDFFRTWLLKLATALFIKAIYSLVIAVVLAVSMALTAATASLGFLMAFALQAVFFWAIFLYRKQIAARLTAATTGDHGNLGGLSKRQQSALSRAAHTAAHPVSALISRPRRNGNDSGDREQDTAAAATPMAAGTTSAPATASVELPGGHAPAARSRTDASSAPTAARGQERSTPKGNLSGCPVALAAEPGCRGSGWPRVWSTDGRRPGRPGHAPVRERRPAGQRGLRGRPVRL